ncbi:TadE/TadG family type IV pilus assembly protein [Catenulispora rubra]|uniref:TadE/TadG family type IV pilus assembly protein n=1 Tax=Catenulispora rubra TaxID=280293 RepID=UPI0018922231|nr:TadE/TadG family type IV pilus assembly protein [Catenulispora rubra]
MPEQNVEAGPPVRHRGLAGRVRRLREDGERGSVTTELVIATPLLLLLVLAVIQFGLLWHAEQVAQTAASQAVNAARAQNTSGAVGQGRGEQILSQLGSGVLTSKSISVSRGAGQVTADVQGQVESIIPGWHPSVHAHAAAPVEVYVP